MELAILPAPTPAFEALVDAHTDFCDATAPPESCHRLPVSRLFTPEITVWTVTAEKDLIGMGALKELSDTDGEIKSMHTRPAARGKGVGRLILRTILTEAKSRKYTGLWLETGVHPGFAPARDLYQAHGFAECPPFGEYVLDPHSVFMTLDLTKNEALQ